jgi:hypothetical protein
MKKHALYRLIRIIFFGCIVQGCSATETVTISSPAQETQPIEYSTSVHPSLPPSTLSAEATITKTLIPATQIPTAEVPGPTATRTFAPFLPGYLAFSVWGEPPNGIAVINSDGSGWRWVTNEYPIGIQHGLPMDIG